MIKEKISVIINPNAGYGKGPELMNLIEQELANHFHVEMLPTQQPHHGTMLAREAIARGTDGLIAVGGDGTIFEVINGMIDCDAFFGVIPAGSANVFSIQMKIPSDPVKACHILTKKNIKEIDLGQADDKKFILMAGVGFDAQVINDLNLDVKRMLKDIAYKITGIKTLFTYTPAHLQLKIDDQIETDGYFVVVGNARYYAGHYTITRKAQIDDGLLDVCLFRSGKIKDFIKYIAGVMTDTHLFLKDVKYYQAKEVEITSDKKVFVQADGESIGELPMIFKVLPSALKVVVP